MHRCTLLAHDTCNLKLPRQVRYVWAVEHRRRDVAVIDQNLLTAVWFTRMQGHHFTDIVFPHRTGRLSASRRTPTNFNCAELLDANIARRPIYVANDLKDNTWRSSYQLVPEGLVQRVFPLRQGPGRAQKYNATKWLEGLLEGTMVRRAERILLALLPESEGAGRAGYGDKSEVGVVEGDGKAGGKEEIDTCEARVSDSKGSKGGRTFLSRWMRGRSEGFASGSWESKVQLELLAAHQRLVLHTLQVLAGDAASSVCSRGSCLVPLEMLARSLENTLAHLGDQPGILVS